MIAKQSYKLTPVQRKQLIEWLVQDRTPVGIRALIEQQQREAPARGELPFPTLTLGAIRYYQKSLYRRICLAKEESAPKPGGALDPQERLMLLRQAAEVLIPHLGSASQHGVFTAAETFVKLLREIDSQQRHMAAHSGSFNVENTVKGMSTEELRQQITLMKARKQG